MARQYEKYRRDGFPDNDGIIPEGGVIIRRHHSPPVRAAMEDWWSELCLGSARDQISLPYVIWRHSLLITLLDWDLRESPWFNYSPHKVRSVSIFKRIARRLHREARTLFKGVKLAR